MNRLTFEGNFCDIAMCQEVRGGSFCKDGYCSQYKVWERLKAYEDMEEQGLLLRLPCKIGERIYQVIPDYTSPDKALFIEEDVFHLGLLTDSGELPANCYFTLKAAEKALEETKGDNQ